MEVVVVEADDGPVPGLWQKAGKKTQRLPPMLPKFPPVLPKFPPKKNLEDGSGAAATRPTVNRTTGNIIYEKSEILYSRMTDVRGNGARLPSAEHNTDSEQQHTTTCV